MIRDGKWKALPVRDYAYGSVQVLYDLYDMLIRSVLTDPSLYFNLSLLVHCTSCRLLRTTVVYGRMLLWYA